MKKYVETLIFNLFFILYYFQWHLKSLWAPNPMEILVQFFPLLAICLYAKNTCDPFIPWGDICDQRILRSNWLKAFPAIIQEQEFSQIWYLYSKIYNNINFYLNTFPAKINDETFQNKGKTLLCGHFWAYFVIFAKREFFLKNLAKYNCSGPPAFKRQKYTVDCPSNQAKIINYSAQFMMVYKASSTFDHAHPIIIKVTFSFPKFVKKIS